MSIFWGTCQYGWELDLREKKDLVIKSLETAVKTIKKLRHDMNKIICHQDQGSQYTSYEYIEKLRKNDFLISFSQKGTPTDNPGQESFFGRFKEGNKDEIVEIETFDELKKFVKNRIKYYNERRLHTGIGNKTPKEFTKFSLRKYKKRFSIFRT